MGQPRVPAKPSDASRPALAMLWEAWQAARAARENVWQFAVEVPRLLDRGLSLVLLRQWLRAGLVVHAAERTEGRRRVFWHLVAPELPARTAVVLTEAGARWAGQVLGAGAEPLPTPVWNAELRELSYGAAFRKPYRREAENQTLVLAAFQEQGWPDRIDDPLRRGGGMNAGQRLRNVVKNLNRALLGWPIRFHTDGQKRGLRWERTGK